MSYKLKRVMSLMIAVFVAFGMMVVGTGEANAASAKVVTYVSGRVLDEEGMSLENHIYVGEEGYAGAYDARTDKEVIINSVTVSDKSIAKVRKSVYKFDGRTYRDFFVIGKKPGKVKVTFKYNIKGKKKVTTKSKYVTVHEYPNPIKSVTVNGINKKMTKDRWFWYSQKYKKAKTSVKVKVVPAEGWKIKKVNGNLSYIKNKSYKNKTVKSAKSKVTKGSKISYPKKYTDLYLNVEMVGPNGQKFVYTVDLYRL